MPLPNSLVPMQPELAPEPFHRPGWVYEEKYDGWRIMAYKDGDSVRLMSRTGVDHAARFPEITAAIAGLVAPQLILDARYVSSMISSLARSTCWAGMTRA